MGNLTSDPEVNYTTNGKAFCLITLAVNEKYKTQSGELKEEVHFFPVTIWGKRAELVGQYIRKGNALFIDGKLEQQRWTTNEGDNKSKIIIRANIVEFIRWGQTSQQQQQPSQPQFQQKPPMPEPRFDTDNWDERDI